MIKYAGIILISGGITMFGYHKAFRIKENILIRKALYELIVYIKSCIESSSLPLTSVYASFDNSLLEKKGFMKLLKSSDGNGFEAALCNTELELPDGLLKIYKELAGSIGKSRSVKLETELLQRYIKIIDTEEEKLIKDDQSKIQLFKKLGILTGLLAALILA